MPRNWKDWSVLIIALLIPQLIGVIGSAFTFFGLPLWYDTLIRPSFSPPNWVFGPVWTLLYILMGVSLYIVWQSRGGSIEKARSRKHGLAVFGVQLVLNALWSGLFFGAHDPLLALVDLVLLIVFVLLSMFYFYPVKRMATYLLVPYLLWLIFAGILNGAIVLLN